MFVIDDIIWLDTIVEKLAWKHRVFTSEVEEVLTGPANAEYIGRKRVTWTENTYITPLAKQVPEGIFQCSSLRN